MTPLHHDILTAIQHELLTWLNHNRPIPIATINNKGLPSDHVGIAITYHDYKGTPGYKNRWIIDLNLPYDSDHCQLTISDNYSTITSTTHPLADPHFLTILQRYINYHACYRVGYCPIADPAQWNYP